MKHKMVSRQNFDNIWSCTFKNIEFCPYLSMVLKFIIVTKDVLIQHLHYDMWGGICQSRVDLIYFLIKMKTFENFDR